MLRHRSRLLVSLAVSAACVVLVAHDLHVKHHKTNLFSWIVSFARQAPASGTDPGGVTGQAADTSRLDMTALTHAVIKGSYADVTALIRSGAAVNQADPAGRTPLIAAINTQNIHIMRMLLDAGSDPNLPGADRYDSQVIESPMQAVALEALESIRKHETRNKEFLAMYRLLKRFGVTPTAAQARAMEERMPA